MNVEDRVPTTEPAVTAKLIDGILDAWHITVVDDAHAAVVHTTPSMRLLGVPSVCPKLSPVTVMAAFIPRAAFMTPKKLATGAGSQCSIVGYCKRVTAH